MAGTQAGEARRDAPQDEADGEPARGVSAIRRFPPPATQHASKPRHAGEVPFNVPFNHKHGRRNSREFANLAETTLHRFAPRALDNPGLP